MDKQSKYLARDNEFLCDHLKNVASLSKAFLEEFDAGNIGFLVGILHDFGKYTNAFQDYLRRSLNGEKGIRGEQIHAFQGAKFLLENIDESSCVFIILRELLANVIEAHHSGLFDGIDTHEKPVLEKIKRDNLHYEEAKNGFLEELGDKIQSNFKEFCCEEFVRISSKFHDGGEKCFMLHLLTKFIYSSLVDADRFDAAGLDVNNEIKRIQNKDVFKWDLCLEKLNKHISYFSLNFSINKARKNISDQCKKAGIEREQGVFSLSVPTGAGKTLSSLRFALEHAKKYQLSHVIYVIPYLSIIDQTAKTIKEVFGYDEKNDDYILEHHSNIEISDNEEDENKYKLLTSRWDSPIILTTMVQFLETIYSNKPSKLRKFHNMSNSVIIFDEVQALPIKCISLFNMAVNFLNTFAKTTVLLCTATKPHFDEVKHRISLSKDHELVKLSDEDKKLFKRVNIVDKLRKENEAYTNDDLVELIKKQIEARKSTLVVLNTKKTASSLFNDCKNADLNCDKFFLSTNLCPVHRLDVIEKIKNKLNKKNSFPILCISTQLIEAGVDISFDCVIRACCGFDSIIQTAGRCNRNGESKDLQDVYVVNIKDENISRLDEIKEGKKISERIIRENKGRDFFSDEILDCYYKYFYYEQINKMDYELSNLPRETMYNLLGVNQQGRKTYQNGNDIQYVGLSCAFKTAAEEFFVIDKQGTVGVVIPFNDEAKELIKSYDEKKSFEVREKTVIMRKLQRYSVSVYQWGIEELKKNHALSVTEDKPFYHLINEVYYDKDLGLKF